MFALHGLSVIIGDQRRWNWLLVLWLLLLLSWSWLLWLLWLWLWWLWFLLLTDSSKQLSSIKSWNPPDSTQCPIQELEEVHLHMKTKTETSILSWAVKLSIDHCKPNETDFWSYRENECDPLLSWDLSKPTRLDSGDPASPSEIGMVLNWQVTRHLVRLFAISFSKTGWPSDPSSIQSACPCCRRGCHLSLPLLNN
jgi:hypothetical protein